jgi:predicted nucleotidyltransferase
VQNGELIEQLPEKLQPLFRRPDIRLVVVFGSRVSGQVRKSSDLDIAILGDRPLDTVDLTNLVMQLVGFSEVDMVDLSRCSPTLAMIVATRGKVLCERAPGDFASFCSLSLRRYEDARKMRAAQKEAILNFLRRRGL